MKKLFLLPLVAMLCFGCSKTDLQGNSPEIAKQESNSMVAQEYVQVTFNNYVDGNLANYSYLEYVDEYGKHQTLYPTGITNYINVAKTGYVSVNIFVDALGGSYTTINASISADTDPAFYQDFTGVNPITGGTSIGMANVSGDRVTITLMAGLQ